MMKAFILIVMTFPGVSCSNNSGKPAIIPQQNKIEINTDFFPVTNFIKGQIVEMGRNGINPLKITSAGKKVDSTWLKIEELNTAFIDFLTPIIDSSNLHSFFKENKFLDQTLHTYTFTYEPLTPLPDSIKLQRWDVYIDPDNNSVKRIYMEKNISGTKKLLLTWQSSQWCRIVTVAPNASGKELIEKEIEIKWSFE